MVEEIRDIATPEGSEGLLAIVVTKDTENPVPRGVNFITDKDAELQVAFIKHPSGHSIPSHRHPPQDRRIRRTQEVLIVQRGRLTVNFYTGDGRHVATRSVKEGDVVILTGGGHGFTCDTDVEFVEVKQGPYVSHVDKVQL